MRGGATILIVNDESDVLGSLKEILDICDSMQNQMKKNDQIHEYSLVG